MNKIDLKVEGMMCTGCENRIKNAISKIKGVKEVCASHETGEVSILFDEKTDIEKIKNIIKDLDFKIL